MDADGPTGSDLRLHAGVSRLRTELRELELRMLQRNLRLAELWVVAINIASLALAAAILGALGTA